MTMYAQDMRPRCGESARQRAHAAVVTIALYPLMALTIPVLTEGRAQAQQSITVYTVSQRPVQIPQGQESITKVIELDRILQIENDLASGLENRDPEVAVQTARSRLTDRHRRSLATAWQGLARVQSGDIEHLPAIVFDGEAVWYGTDFRRALRAWRARRP